MSAAVIDLFPHRPHSDAELIAGVLVLMEDAPLSDFAAIPYDASVLVFRDRSIIASLTPEQARTAGHALFHEQAFAGCNEIAALLIEASVAPAADQVEWPADSNIVQMQPRRPVVHHHQARTGFASTFALVSLIVLAYAIAGTPAPFGIG